MRTAIYPGTFDPITKGHENIIERAGSLCDVLYIAIAHGHHKTPTFTIKERLEMSTIVCAELQLPHRIHIISFDGLLIDTCRKLNASLIIRGIRTTSDFEYEAQLTAINHHLGPEIETVFLMSDHRYSFISSSFIREAARLGGDVDGLVHPFIKKNLTRKVLKKY